MKKSLLLCLLSALLMLLPLAGHASVTETWSPMYTVEPTCTEQGYTVYDNFLMPGVLENRDFVPALGHDWGAWETIDTVTCTTDGSRQRVCSRCGEYDVEEIFATGHTPEAVPGEPATCTLPGRTESTRCSVCGEVLSYSRDIPPLGHEWVEERVEPTCITEGYRTSYCSRCGEKGQYTPLSTTDHSWGAWIAVDATCTDGGYAYHTCTVCGETERSRETEPRGHSWDNGTVTAQPTCTQEGVRTFTCTRCGETSTEAIPTINHQSQKVTDPWPTCTEPGQSIYLCPICGEKLTNPDYLPPLGHQWNDGEVTAQPTCSQEGVRTFTCACCGETRTEPIPTVNHQSQKVTDPWPTCTEPGQSIYLCAICGAKLTNPDYLPPLGHEWDEGQVTKEPGELNPGEKTFTCLRCGETKTEEIPIEGTFNDIFQSISDVDFNLPFIYTSPDVSISDPEPDGTPLRIVTQPESCQVPPGGTANLMVTAAGGVPFSIFYDVPMYHYQWYFHPNQTEKDLLSGLVNLLLWLLGSNESITSDDVNDIPVGTLQTLYDAGPGTYYCVVTDDAGDSVTSDMARVKTELYITQQPQNCKSKGLDSAFFVVTVAGGTKPYHYEWHYAYPGTEDLILSHSNQLYVAEAAYYQSLTDQIKTDENATYFCIITDADGDSITSDTVRIYPYSSLKILHQPQKAEYAGAQLTVEIVENYQSKGTHMPVTFQWMQFGIPVGEPETVISTGEPISHTFQAVKSGKYYCKISDPAETVYSNAVEVPNKILVTGLNSEYILSSSGESAALNAVASKGTGPYTYEWSGNGKQLTGVTGSTLQTAEEGNYSVIVTDAYGNFGVAGPAQVLRRELKIKTQPKDGKLSYGGSYQLQIEMGEGTLPFTYEVKQYNPSWANGTVLTSDSAAALTVSKPGQYYIRVTDGKGLVATSRLVTVEEYDHLHIESYTQNPEITSAKGNGIARLEVAASGGKKPYTYSWSKQSAAGSGYALLSDEELNRWLTYNPYNSYFYSNEIGAVYACTVTDDNGETATVDGMEVIYTGKEILITHQPESVLLDYNEENNYSAKLSIEAFGPPDHALLYVWSRKDENGSKVAGYGEVLDLYENASTPEDKQISGTYYCTVWDTATERNVKSKEVSVQIKMTVYNTEVFVKKAYTNIVYNYVTDSIDYEEVVRNVGFKAEIRGGKAPYTIWSEQCSIANGFDYDYSTSQEKIPSSAKDKENRHSLNIFYTVNNTTTMYDRLTKTIVDYFRIYVEDATGQKIFVLRTDQTIQ
ncbi:MAG: hypothetical protein Q4G00_05640 [Clostridia bacterium]|nr:hypothetical protein [Clostridia bacterium]